MADDGQERVIYLEMPSVKIFGEAVAMARATGARVASSHTFKIEGTMTVEQVGHLLNLVGHVFEGEEPGERAPFEVSVYPPVEYPPFEEWGEAEQWYGQ